MLVGKCAVCFPNHSPSPIGITDAVDFSSSPSLVSSILHFLLPRTTSTSTGYFFIFPAAGVVVVVVVVVVHVAAAAAASAVAVLLQRRRRSFFRCRGNCCVATRA